MAGRYDDGVDAVSQPVVEVRDLQYAYPDGHPALRGLSFSIADGETVAIVGANGAGKSTILLHLNGCLMPQAGTVRIRDLPVSKRTLPDVRRTVGMVFQDPDDQLFMPTVYEDVAFGPLNLGLPAEEVDRRVMHALSIVGAVHLKYRPPYRLSGGEKRAVAIASVLSMSPTILVMDEPTSNLDPQARRRLIELLKTFEQTIIVATHDLDMAFDLCARTIVVKEGGILADGPSREILQDAALLAAGQLERPLGLQGCPVCSPPG
jgi:cobalt/nickel transport system ATP-binding protein